tara:strand:- start:8327 stop:10276 length:1950 start_codon:yes stop_codon:yes gene_type:complete
MLEKNELISTLTHPGNVRFHANKNEVLTILKEAKNLKKISIGDIETWFLDNKPTIANTRIRRYSTGHFVFYNSEGKRFLFADPEGHPLHECEWKTNAKVKGAELTSVRMQLDCKQWVGIKPNANTFSVVVNLKEDPRSLEMSLDDLRKKAARAWDIPISEIEHFYKDENFIRHGANTYEIRLTKDALYLLVNETFDQTIFVSNMPKTNWEALDIITVVELFQSVPPGAGGAAFEFLWGLREDQAREKQPEPLRFRGLPVYPSEKAFQIFSAFFSPTAPGGEDVMDVFMDFHRSHQISWNLRANPPWRYFSDEHSVCLTVQDNFLYKVTSVDDSTALPFTNCSRGAKDSCQRQAHVSKDSIVLLDSEEVVKTIPLLSQWQISPQNADIPKQPAQPFGWRKFFKYSLPKVDPAKAALAVPFYPEGAKKIEERSLQPMVVDQIFLYMEMFQGMPGRLEKTDRVLVHNFDAAIAGCIDCKRKRTYKVLFNSPEFAQRNAHFLWDYAVSKGQLNNLREVFFLQEKEYAESVYKEEYEMIFRWIPFESYHDPITCENILNSVCHAMASNALLFIVGPSRISNSFKNHSLQNIFSDPVKDMPFFMQHKKMYPETQVNSEVSVFLAQKTTQKSSIKAQKPHTQVSWRTVKGKVLSTA